MLIRICVILFTISTLLLMFGCSDTKVILPCDKPERIISKSVFSLKGDLSITSATGALGSAIKNDLDVTFSKSEPDDWTSIADTYMYQTCQFVSATSCDGLDKGECLDKKQKIYNDAFTQIQGLLNDQREHESKEAEDKAKADAVKAKAIADAKQAEKEAAKKKAARIAAAAKRKRKVESCITGKIQEFQKERTLNPITAGARAQAPGYTGVRKNKEETVCHQMTSNQTITSTTIEQTCCWGGRCSHSAPKYSDGHRKVCVIVKAWSESGAFKAGGCAKYNLNITYQNIATESQKNNFRSQCDASVS